MKPERIVALAKEMACIGCYREKQQGGCPWGRRACANVLTYVEFVKQIIKEVKAEKR